MNLLLASTSTVHGQPYLSYFKEAWSAHFANTQGKPVIFVPYARPGGMSFDDYSAIATKAFAEQGIAMRGIHSYTSIDAAMADAGGVFIGGGNTFLLLKTLYDSGAFAAIDAAVRSGLPYMGSSAGSNMAGMTLGTTNDMPIIYPPSFDTFSWIPCNLNPHYLDPEDHSTHMGESRATRIAEFHQHNNQAVIGLREGSWLKVEAGEISLLGPHSARVFHSGKAAYEQAPGPLQLNDRLTLPRE